MKKSSLIISLILVVGPAGLWGPWARPRSRRGPRPRPQPAQAPTVLAPDTFANLAKQVSGAVVNISAEKIVKNQMQEYVRTRRQAAETGPGPGNALRS